MKLFSTDDQSELEILYKRDEDYASFTCGVTVIGPCAEFKAANHDLFFFETDKFIRNFQMFIDGNAESVSLEGTYDTKITFTRKAKNSVMVSFCIGVQSDAYAETVEHKLTGAFQIRSESLGAYKREFVELFGGGR